MPSSRSSSRSRPTAASASRSWASTAATSSAAAKRFLAEHPLPYPSYEDPDEDISRDRKVPKNYPMTLFIDERGKTAFIHAGEYTSPADLEADIDRYLG